MGIEIIDSSIYQIYTRLQQRIDRTGLPSDVEILEQLYNMSMVSCWRIERGMVYLGEQLVFKLKRGRLEVAGDIVWLERVLEMQKRQM